MAYRMRACSVLGRRFSSAAAIDGATVDVAIVGGGMVGLAVAAALRCTRLTAELQVAVLDRQQPQNVLQQPLPEVPELRVSTLTPASTALLERVGAWRHCAPPRSSPFFSMQVWDAGGDGFIRWEASEAGQPAMGHVVENTVIQSALLCALEEAPHGGPDLLEVWPTRVAAIGFPPAWAADSAAAAEGADGLATLHLENGSRLKARLVVGADGSNSQVRSLAGIRTGGWNYNQRGVVATVETRAENSTAWQRFLSTGPLAVLPVRDNRSSIVWTTTAEHARHLESLQPMEFAQAVNDALTSKDVGAGPGTPGARSVVDVLYGLRPPSVSRFVEQAASVLPGVNPISSAAWHPPPEIVRGVGGRARSFPLRLQHSGRYVRPRLALVGDAAHAVHPLGGQGLNMGLGDAAVLAEAVRYGLEHGMDLGSCQLLQDHYQTPQLRTNITMSAALDALQRLFCNQMPLLRQSRSVGLDALNLMPGLKNSIMKYAMGL